MRAANVSPTGVMLSRFASQITARPRPCSSRMNASRRPSGDHTGNELCTAPEVSARGARPTAAERLHVARGPVGRGSCTFHSSSCR